MTWENNLIARVYARAYVGVQACARVIYFYLFLFFISTKKKCNIVIIGRITSVYAGFGYYIFCNTFVIM